MVAPVRHVAELAELDMRARWPRSTALTTGAIETLRRSYRPDAFNVGWNLGAVAGGSIAGHLHEHVVPRWAGDTNFMPVLADVKVLPEHLVATRERLRAGMDGRLTARRPPSAAGGGEARSSPTSRPASSSAGRTGSSP